MPETKPIVVVCPKCGSADVCCDAAGRWDIEAQDWTLSSAHESKQCCECDYEGDAFSEREATHEELSRAGSPAMSTGPALRELCIEILKDGLTTDRRRRLRELVNK